MDTDKYLNKQDTIQSISRYRIEQHKESFIVTQSNLEYL